VIDLLPFELFEHFVMLFVLDLFVPECYFTKMRQKGNIEY